MVPCRRKTQDISRPSWYLLIHAWNEEQQKQSGNSQPEPYSQAATSKQLDKHSSSVSSKSRWIWWLIGQLWKLGGNEVGSPSRNPHRPAPCWPWRRKRFASSELATRAGALSFVICLLLSTLFLPGLLRGSTLDQWLKPQFYIAGPNIINIIIWKWLRNEHGDPSR